ncbi:MAG: hypothetical protein WA210_23870 [Burkholderiaceae bacterium]
MTTSTARRINRTQRKQRGTTLLEGLVAFLVLSLGMLSVVRVQTQMRLTSDVARQRSEAVRIAQEDVEKMRAFSVIAVRAGASAYASLASASSNIDAHSGQPSNTNYVLTREVSAASTPRSKNVNVSVAWDDRTGARQRVSLSTLIAGHDPAYSGALKLIPKAAPLRSVRARSVWIPIEAKDLGNGSSAYKPLANGSAALVLDNASGKVIARCVGVDPAASNSSLDAAALGACETMQAQLLSGVVRFSSATPPDPSAANDVPLALSMAIVRDPGRPAPACTSEARKTVTYTRAGSTYTDAVAIGASAASLGLSSWVETGERYVAYHCVVIPASPDGLWSGRANIVASGWTVGRGTNDSRVCRYSADFDRSGAIDSNLEHPDTYTAVGSSLTNQNFLVIAGTQSCPTQMPANGANGIYADLSTVPHQP